MNNKYLNWTLLSLIILSFLPIATRAQENNIDVYFFYSETCPHCAEEAFFLDRLEADLPYVQVHEYEVSEIVVQKAMRDVADVLGGSVGGVPFTIIGNWSYTGYRNESTTGRLLNDKVNAYHDNYGAYEDVVGQFVADIGETPHSFLSDEPSDSDSGGAVITETTVKLPFWGQVDIADWSLPVATLAIGLLDGFNPCAMWVLLFLISMLIGMKNRGRAWALGVAFIVVSAFVYFLFMTAWLNLFILIGFVAAVRIIIGIVAGVGGAWHLRGFWKSKDGGCEVVDEKKRDKISARLKRITSSGSFWVALGGIAALAFGVNLVELICSAGLPAVYTKLLTMNDLSTAGYYGYLLLYIFVFMIDDLAVFIIAMLTMRLTGISTKYQRWTSLIGGILMVTIGILLIFAPGVLTFGGS